MYACLHAYLHMYTLCSPIAYISLVVLSAYLPSPPICAIYTYIHTCVCMCIYTGRYVYIYMYVYVYVYVYMYTHIDTHIHSICY